MAYKLIVLYHISKGSLPPTLLRWYCCTATDYYLFAVTILEWLHADFQKCSCVGAILAQAGPITKTGSAQLICSAYTKIQIMGGSKELRSEGMYGTTAGARGWKYTPSVTWRLIAISACRSTSWWNNQHTRARWRYLRVFYYTTHSGRLSIQTLQQMSSS